MTNEEMKTKLESVISYANINAKYGNQLEIITPKENIVDLLNTLKRENFEHLANITCVDMIDEGCIIVTYNIWSYTHKLHITVKASTKRNKAEINTTMELWPQAQVYERELHEMFGVHFNGNPNLKPLFLHNWQDIPPLRKDFNSEEYSRIVYMDESEGEAK